MADLRVVPAALAVWLALLNTGISYAADKTGGQFSSGGGGNDHTDAASLQSESAYRDLVRLTGRDPAAEISARFGQDAPHQSR
jgi:hypothetical protein